MLNDLSDELIPRSIRITNYTYSFKEKRANGVYVYRCRTRKCGVLISINEINLKKIINKTDNQNIEFTKLSKKEHICQENNMSIPNNEITTFNENMQLAEELIKKI